MATGYAGGALTARPVIGEAWRVCWQASSRPYLTSTAEVGDLVAAVAAAAAAAGGPVTPVVLCDVAAGGAEAVEVLRRARAVVVLLVPPGLSREHRAALRIGVDAMVTLDDGVHVLGEAVAATTTGQAYASPTAARFLLDELRQRRHDPAVVTEVVLSERERAVLQAMVEGLTTKATAQRLGISIKTVEAHRTRVYTRLHVRSQSEAVSRALGDRRLLGSLGARGPNRP